MIHQSQNLSFLFVPYSNNLKKSQSKIMKKMTKSISVLKFFIVLKKSSWACSWDSHEHLCSWKLHEHAHETFTRTCAWSCHGQDHFIELCFQDAYCPIVVVRVTPSRARARESFMSMLMKLSWAQMLMRASWACSWRLHEHNAGVQWTQYGPR